MVQNSEIGTIRDSFYEDHAVYSEAADVSFDDGSTFTGYGDISRSEITFVPSALSGVSPQKKDSTYRRNARRPVAPVLKKNALLRTKKEEKDAEEESIAKLTQKAVISQPQIDFDCLVQTLRATRARIHEERPALPILEALEAKSERMRRNEKMSSMRQAPSALKREKFATATPDCGTNVSGETTHSSPVPERLEALAFGTSTTTCAYPQVGLNGPWCCSGRDALQAEAGF
ncbi:hypothetical protein AAF712_000383 [Marasmius tenuissimus]|uniref:Uncharacterized protein n=1 Tax=Marasmius tenuissimus TaxID=585030 RepID=A0ABR3AGD8_9AGAR